VEKEEEEEEKKEEKDTSFDKIIMYSNI